MSHPASTFPVKPSRSQSVLLPAIIVSGVCLVGGSLPAQTNLHWDTGTGGGLQGGAGTWSTAAANWNDSAGTAGANVVWSGTGNIANFSGTSGTVTVDTSITLSRLNATAGYSFSGTGGLDFGANAGVIDTSSNISTFGIGLAGTNGITKSGSGTFTFTGTGTYSGTLRVSGGTFTLGNTTATANRLSSTSSLAIGSSSANGTFSMVAATGGTSSQTFANLGAGAGLNVLQSSGASATNIANITFNGTYSRSNTGVVSFLNATGFNVTANFTNNNDGTHNIDGVLVGASRSNNTFVANNNTANGAPTSTNNVWSSGTHTVATSNNGTAYTGSTASLRLSNTRTVTLGAGAVINTGMIANNGGSFTGTITGGTLTSGNGRDLILLGGDSGYRIEIASQIVNNGSTPIGLLVANATGTTGNLISGNNSHTGDTTLAASFTIAGHDSAFGTGKIVFAGGALGASIGSTRVLANDISIVAATANLNGLNQSASSPFGGPGTTYDLTLSGNISGSGNLSLNNGIGANKVTLSGNNSSHTGTVIVNNAATTLALGSANAIGTGVSFAAAGTVTSSDATARSFTVNNYPAAGGTFGTAGTGDLSVTMPTLGASAYSINVGNSLTTIANSLNSGAGATLAKNGTGTLALAGTFGLFSGTNNGVTLNAGAIQYGTGGAEGFLNLTGANAVINGTAAGTKVIFNRNNALSVEVPLTGSLGVEQIGSGATTLTKDNTYTGTTSVTAGKLLINGNQSAATGNVSVSNVNTTLAGTGTVGGATTIHLGAIHAPGLSVGIQNFTSHLNYADGSVFAWEIDRTKEQTRLDGGYDAVNVTGVLTGVDGADDGTSFNAIFRIVIGETDFSNPFWTENNHTWTDIFTAADGATAKANWANIFGGGFQYYDTSGSALPEPTTGSFGLSGNTLTWTFTPVPEPSCGLATGGLLALALCRRRRSSAAG